jgi:hypothetical protein|tara:strand:+ start:478 stop:645 length:168 start_codon:yes stop_codon:yes gene_type:complete
MGCGCKDKRKYPHNIKRNKKPSTVTREQVQTKEEKILELKGALREQLLTFKKLTR